MTNEVYFSLNDCSLSYGKKKIFERISFSLHENDKIALIGKNGVGKSSLLKIIAGDLPIDFGELWLSQRIKIGFLNQSLSEKNDLKINDALLNLIKSKEQEYFIDQVCDELKIDKTHIIVAGESGGGNLTIATGLKLKQDGKLSLIRGLYSLCPYIAGFWPLPENPSSTENNGILLDLHNNYGRLGYGIEEYEKKNPLAWPGFASEDDVIGLVPTIISVNECDPLRDEGINFYRLLLRAGVQARCRQVMGTIHGTEIFPSTCPDISRDTAADIANFCKTI